MAQRNRFMDTALRSRRSNVLRAPTTSLTTTRASSAYGCRRSHVLAGRRNRCKSPSRTLWRLLAPTASITRRACAGLQREGPTRTQFPPASARMAPGTSGPGLTGMNEISPNFAKKGN